MKDWYPWAKGSAGWNLSVAPLSVARNAGLHQEGAVGGRKKDRFLLHYSSLAPWRLGPLAKDISPRASRMGICGWWFKG